MGATFQPQSVYFIVDNKGLRTPRCYGQYNGGKEKAEQVCKPGETIEERMCPYPGCEGGPQARPPCGLCYE